MSAHSYYGVTITLAGSTTEGSYVTGEPYIILAGATSLTAIDNPSFQGYGTCSVVGGAMINPVPLGSQGLVTQYVPTSGHVHRYDSAKNVALALPVNVSPGDMLLVDIARNDGASKVATYVRVCFSFVSSAPSAGSLRPGFYGTERTPALNESDVQWQNLKSIPRASIAGAQTLAYMSDTTRFPALPWFSWGDDWPSSVIMPQLNTANSNNENTAQFSSTRFGHAAMWLNMDWTQAEKRTLLLKILQNGIDIAAYFAQGGNLLASGSHQTGYKMPLFFAAVMFENAEMLAISRNPANFVEGNLTTWRINSSDIGRSFFYDPDGGGPITGENYYFEAGDVGRYWWGIGHNGGPFNSVKDRPPSCPENDPYYPVYSHNFGSLIAARVMGRSHDWGWTPAFHWMEEYISTYGYGLLGTPFQSFYDHVMLDLPPLVEETSPTPTPLNSTVLEPGQSFALTPDPWGHPVRYTTGSSPADPTSSTGTAYTAPITGISASTTLKAKSFPADYQDPSATATIAVTVITNGTPTPPTNLTIS